MSTTKGQPQHGESTYLCVGERGGSGELRGEMLAARLDHQRDRVIPAVLAATDLGERVFADAVRHTRECGDGGPPEHLDRWVPEREDGLHQGERMHPFGMRPGVRRSGGAAEGVPDKVNAVGGHFCQDLVDPDSLVLEGPERGGLDGQAGVP